MSGETKDDIFDYLDQENLAAFRNMLEENSINAKAIKNGRSILEYASVFASVEYKY